MPKERFKIGVLVNRYVLKYMFKGQFINVKKSLFWISGLEHVLLKVRKLKDSDQKEDESKWLNISMFSKPMRVWWSFWWSRSDHLIFSRFDIYSTFIFVIYLYEEDSGE